jgi:hypothetical protein
MKLSESPPPAYVTSDGQFSVDYRNHNGRIILGTGDWLFETAWSKGGANSIHVYNDPPSIRGLAVAPTATTIEHITEDVFARSNFTSRTRTPRIGQVVLFENNFGFAAAVEILDIKISEEGELGTLLKARFRILTDGNRDFSIETGANQKIQNAVAEALSALGKVEPEKPIEIKGIGIGHNNPPMESALDSSDYKTVKNSLIKIDHDVANDTLTSAKAESVLTALKNTIVKIQDWVMKRIKLIEDGFYKGIGTALFLTVAANWAFVVEKMQSVTSAVTGWLAG